MLVFSERLKMELCFLSRSESTPPSLHPFYNFDNKLISSEIFLQFGKQTVRFVRKLKSVHKLWAFKFHGFDMRFCSPKYFSPEIICKPLKQTFTRNFAFYTFNFWVFLIIFSLWIYYLFIFQNAWLGTS